MKRAWDQFALIIMGAMVVVYAVGVIQDIPLDQILIRVLVVGAGLAAFFTLVHAWLRAVFRRSTERERVASAKEPSERQATLGLDAAADVDMSGATAAADGGDESPRVPANEK